MRLRPVWLRRVRLRLWLVLAGALLAGGPGGAGAAGGPRCAPAAAASCRELYNVTGEYTYAVDGGILRVYYTAIKSFKLVCQNVSLESGSLPRFGEPTGFELVALERCALPAGALAASLAALRVHPLDALELLAVPPARAALSAPHLDGLLLRSLKVDAPGELTADEDFLRGLPQLEALELSGVRLAEDALGALPVGLRALRLAGAGLRVVRAAKLARLPALRFLKLREPTLAAPPELGAAPALAELWLMAPRLDALIVGPSLENVTLVNMNLTRIEGNCSKLTRLTAVRVWRLPVGGWARCPRLAELRLKQCPLAAGALHGAATLRLLSATGVPSPTGAALPPDLLREAPNLRDLDLSGNGLQNLPEGLWGASAALERLELRGNQLRAAALAALEPLARLSRLGLDGNPLADLCVAADTAGTADTADTAAYHANGMSALRGLRELRSVSLRAAGVPRVCRDWRDPLLLPHLARLDLRGNNITELGYWEATWARGTLDVRGNPLRAVRYDRGDYERALAAPPAPLTRTANESGEVLVDGVVACDCRAYWFARALRDRPRHVSPALAALRCIPPAPPAARPAARPGTPPAPPAALLTVPLEQLECAVPQEQCVAGCSCAVDGWRSVVRCAGGGLVAPPRLPGLPPPRALLLARNHIAALPASLPPELELIDLRDNRLASANVSQWAALLSRGRRALLAGNPLACACDHRAALALLQAHATQLDVENMTCADGRALLAVQPAALCEREPEPRAVPLGALLGALLAASLLLALLVLACLARPAARQWIKRFLVQHNLCLSLLLRPNRVERPRSQGKGQGEGAEEQHDYDVFVSFSHRDHEFVTRELVPRLEGAARPRRLCLHYRDWTPGEWIPAQIESSVRRARRTLVVLSEHFLRSGWARAEFREAHAAALRDVTRRRLVALLLAPPDALPLDRELRAFLAAHTYLLRDDPRCWDKLLDALPAAATPPPTPAPAPAPPA